MRSDLLNVRDFCLGTGSLFFADFARSWLLSTRLQLQILGLVLIDDEDILLHFHGQLEISLVWNEIGEGSARLHH